METLPDKIAYTWERVKKVYPFYVTLKNIGGRYYLYKQSGVWDKEAQKTKVTSEYLGRITNNGAYIKKRFSAKGDLENAKALIAEHGGEVLWHDESSKKKTMARDLPLNLNETDLRILTILSMDARTPVITIAKKVGIGIYAVRSRIKRLEKSFGMRYLLELDNAQLGLVSFVTFVKFEREQPSLDAIRRILNKSVNVQFAALLNGDYDLIIYSLHDSPISAFEEIHDIRRTSELRDYNSLWYTTVLAQTHSFIPIRKETMESILKAKEWKRTRKHTKIGTDELAHREAIALNELNADSRKNFKDMEKGYNLGNGTIRKAYHDLKERGIIKRPTVSVDVGIKYISIILLDIINVGDTYKTWGKRLADYMSDGPVVNKYSLIGYMGLPDSAILFMPIMSDGDMNKTGEFLQNTSSNGIRKRTLVITNILVGSLCHRRFDNKFSRHYGISQVIGGDVEGVSSKAWSSAGHNRPIDNFWV